MKLRTQAFCLNNLITGNQPEGRLWIESKTFHSKSRLGETQNMMMCHANAIDEDGSLVQVALSRDEQSIS